MQSPENRGPEPFEPEYPAPPVDAPLADTAGNNPVDPTAAKAVATDVETAAATAAATDAERSVESSAESSTDVSAESSAEASAGASSEALNTAVPVMAPPDYPPVFTFEPPSPPRREVWGAWPTVGLGAAIFSINGFIQTAVMVYFAVFWIKDFGFYSFDEFAANRMLQDLLSNGQALALAIILSAVVGIAFTLLFVRLRHGYSIARYLALKPINWKVYLVLIGVFAGLLGISFGMGLLVQSDPESDIFMNAYQNTRWPVAFWLALVVFAPLFEETLFRGFLFAGLERSGLGVAGTIVVTGLVFALLHAAQYGAAVIALIFIMGIVFGVVRWRTGSLWSTIFLHGLWNCGQLVIMTFWPALNF